MASDTEILASLYERGDPKYKQIALEMLGIDFDKVHWFDSAEGEVYPLTHSEIEAIRSQLDTEIKLREDG